MSNGHQAEFKRRKKNAYTRYQVQIWGEEKVGRPIYLNQNTYV